MAERSEITTYSSAHEAGAPHVSQFPSGGLQLVESALELAPEEDVIVKISARDELVQS